MTLVCPGGLSDTVTSLLKIWWTSCDGLGPLPCPWPAQVPMVSITVSWEGLLPALFASWLKICEMTWHEMIWYDMKWYVVHVARKLVTLGISSISGPHQGADVAQLRPLEATVEDAETQLCQNLEGFLVSNQRFFSVQNPGCSCFNTRFFHGWLSTRTTRNCNTTTWYENVYQNYNQCISVLQLIGIGHRYRRSPVCGAQVHGMAIASCPK